MNKFIIILMISFIFSWPIAAEAAVTYTAGNLRLNVSGSETPASIYAADVSGGWGVVSNPATNVYIFSAGIDVADAGTLTINDCQITMDALTTGLTDDYYFSTSTSGTIDINNSFIYCTAYNSSTDAVIEGTGTVTMDNSSINMTNSFSGIAPLFKLINIEIKNAIIHFQGTLFLNCDLSVYGHNIINGTNITSGSWDIFWRSDDDIHTTYFDPQSHNEIKSIGTFLSSNASGESTSQYFRNIYIDGIYRIASIVNNHYIINYSFSNFTLINSGTGKMYVGWYVDPIFVNSLGTLLSNADVTLTNCQPAGNDTTNSNGRLNIPFNNIQGYYTSSGGTILQGTGNEILTVVPTAGEQLTTTVDITHPWDSGYVSVQGIEGIISPTINTFSTAPDGTASIILPSTTGATVEISIYEDTGASVISNQPMVENVAGIYVYEWLASGRSNGDNLIAKISDVSNGLEYTYNIEVRSTSGGSSGGGLTAEQDEILRSIGSRTDEIDITYNWIQGTGENIYSEVTNYANYKADVSSLAFETSVQSVKTQTDKMQFNASNLILADIAEISTGSGGLTGTEHEWLESLANLTDEINLLTPINASTEVMFHYLTGDQMIDRTNGRQTFYKEGSGEYIRIYQLLDQFGATTIDPTQAWGREDITP